MAKKRKKTRKKKTAKKQVKTTKKEAAIEIEAESESAIITKNKDAESKRKTIRKGRLG